MDGTVVDDRKRIHAELRHFAHAFVIRLNSGGARGIDRCINKTLVALPISLNALVLPYTPMINKGKTCRSNLFLKL